MPTVIIGPESFDHGPGTMQVLRDATVTFERGDRTDSFTVTLDTTCFVESQVSLPSGTSSVPAKIRNDAEFKHYPSAYSAPKAPPPETELPTLGTMTGDLDVVTNL